MPDFFQFDYQGAEFVLFGPAHLWSVVGLVVFSAWYLRLGRISAPARRAHLRKGIACFLVCLDLVSHLFWFSAGAWTPQDLLPLHMCSAMTYVMAFAFLTDRPST